MSDETLIWAGLAIAGAVALDYARARSGVELMDRPGMRGRAVLWGRAHGLDPQWVMAALQRESGGDPANYLGDVAASGGPSIGPLQVERITAVAHGFVAADISRADYAALAVPEFEGELFTWGVQVLARARADAGGDPRLTFKNYNGGAHSQSPDAYSYADKALAWIAATYGGSNG